MTKTAIQSVITAIGDGLANKAVKIRAAYTAVLESNYSASILESSSNPTSLTITSISALHPQILSLYENGFLKYDLRFTKKGNLCFVKGFVELLSSAPYSIPTIANESAIFKVINNEYKIKTLIPLSAFFVNENSGFLSLPPQIGLFTITIGIGEKIFIDSFYELEN